MRLDTARAELAQALAEEELSDAICKIFFFFAALFASLSLSLSPLSLSLYSLYLSICLSVSVSFFLFFLSLALSLSPSLLSHLLFSTSMKLIEFFYCANTFHTLSPSSQSSSLPINQIWMEPLQTKKSQKVFNLTSFPKHASGTSNEPSPAREKV